MDGASDVAIDGLLTSSNFLQIGATKEPLSDSRDQSITITSRIALGSQTKLAGGSKFGNVVEVSGCVFVDVDTSFVNWIAIDQIDYDQSIVSGRFRCTMQEPDCPNTKLEITHGRFDLNYRF